METKNNSAPIFIVGSQRSGTTMLRLMLNAHPNISIPFESGFITRIYKKLEEFGDLGNPDNIKLLLNEISNNKFVKLGALIENEEEILNVNPTNYSELISAIYGAYTYNRGKKRWGDKEPAYVTDIDILAKLFPNLKVIHIVRDGRDVAVSMKKLSWGSKNLPRIARDWAWKVMLANKTGAFLGKSQYLEIRYEDLVIDSEKILQKICSFIDEEYSSKMLSYPVTAKEEMPSDSINFHQNSVMAPDKNKIFQWKKDLPTADQIIFQEEAGEALENFGYKKVKNSQPIKVKIRKLYYAIFARW